MRAQERTPVPLRCTRTSTTNCIQETDILVTVIRNRSNQVTVLRSEERTYLANLFRNTVFAASGPPVKATENTLPILFTLTFLTGAIVLADVDAMGPEPELDTMDESDLELDKLDSDPSELTDAEDVFA